MPRSSRTAELQSGAQPGTPARHPFTSKPRERVRHRVPHCVSLDGSGLPRTGPPTGSRSSSGPCRRTVPRPTTRARPRSRSRAGRHAMRPRARKPSSRRPAAGAAAACRSEASPRLAGQPPAVWPRSGRRLRDHGKRHGDLVPHRERMTDRRPPTANPSTHPISRVKIETTLPRLPLDLG